MTRLSLAQIRLRYVVEGRALDAATEAALRADKRAGARAILAAIERRRFDIAARVDHFDPQHRSDPLRAISGAPTDAGLRVLLAHQPRSAEAAASAGFDVQLSGHTHGGQYWPWNLFVKLQQPYTAGLHRLKQLWIYTSRGTGYWGPPLRFLAPSEITRLTFVGAA